MLTMKLAATGVSEAVHGLSGILCMGICTQNGVLEEYLKQYMAQIHFVHDIVMKTDMTGVGVPGAIHGPSCAFCARGVCEAVHGSSHGLCMGLHTQNGA